MEERRKRNYPKYYTRLGCCYNANAEDVLSTTLKRKYSGQVQLILTSPPFPLNQKKQYGNLQGQEYIEWLAGFAPLFARLLTPDGSIVMELGNAWEKGSPVQSLLPMKTLLAFVENQEAGLKLCQEFICHNPARLPSPAQWVNIERCRVTDSYTHIWWMAKSDRPKADNRKVLRPYSKSMEHLHDTQQYNAGKRPSGHNISESSFLINHGGSIMPNALEIESIDPTKDPRLPSNAFSISNTNSADHYHRACREQDILPHPARMAPELASFFINFLTDPGDLVLDPFAGSNTTGYCAELNGRQWVSIEAREDYVKQSRLRFTDLDLHTDKRKRIKGGKKE
ncbi:MAG: site-specific DNA-methyltransferase [Syntrophomonadaceae bacterium]|nr:site-specific DNA-methyltransferase [Syntrophomonadaceae bacterium]